MHYYWPDLQDMRPPPPKPRVRAWQDPDGTVWVTRIGRGWVAVPGEVWSAFAVKVKRGDYDRK